MREIPNNIKIKAIKPNKNNHVAKVFNKKHMLKTLKSRGVGVK